MKSADNTFEKHRGGVMKKSLGLSLWLGLMVHALEQSQRNADILSPKPTQRLAQQTGSGGGQVYAKLLAKR
jgi:hypothetical protein